MAEQSPLSRKLESDEETRLWHDCKTLNSATARERLFLLYLPLAKRSAGRFVRDSHATPLEFGEISQMASMGLLEAIDNFNPLLGVPFRYYCPRRILGSILNGIAKSTEVNQQISTRNRIARERLGSVSSGVAKPQKLDDALDILGDIAASLALGMMLDNGLKSLDTRDDPANNAYETLVWKQAVDRLHLELKTLPEREREVLRYHYLESLGFSEIAGLLGLTKGRISQIHKAAIAMLRKRMSNSGRFKLEG